MVASGGVLPTVVNVNESQALQSVPSKARTCMVSEPELWPPRIHTLWRSAAATVMSVFAAQWALLGVQKYPLLASVPVSQNWYWVAALPSASEYEIQFVTCDHSLLCRLWSLMVTTGGVLNESQAPAENTKL